MQGNIFEGGIDQEFKQEKLLFRYEYYFRSFDLVVIRILKGENPGPSFLGMQEMLGLENLLVRNNLLNHCARAEKSRVERIQFYPVELKSDDDVSRCTSSQSVAQCNFDIWQIYNSFGL